MRVMLLHVALGYLALLAFGKAQINEPTEVEVDDQQHDLVDEPPPSCEEAAAMIESLLEDVGEKESEISNMRIEIQRIQQENAEEVDYALAERDNEILKLRAKLSEVNETENYVRELEANLQSQKDKIMQLEEEPKSKELELEESLNTVRLKLETYETILKDLRGVLVVDNDEELLEAVTELSLNASRMAPVDINNDSLDSDGRTEGNKEVIDGNREDLEDDLHRAQEELANMMEEASLVQNKWKGFVVNVTDLVSELAACRTGEKEMDRAVHGDEEEILTVLKKLSEEVNTCQVEEQKEKESKMDHEDGEEKNFQLDNLKSELESCRSECKAEIAELSKRLLPKEEDKNEDEVLAEHQDSTLLQQAQSLLYGLKNLEGELEGLQEGKESSSQNEARENVAQIVKQLSNALIIGRELADLNGSFPDFQLVADVQDMTEESSSSSSGEDEDVVYDVEPKEEKEEEIEREIQEEHVVEVEVDSQGHTTSQPNESLLSRIGELEEELVKCREKYELQSILDYRNTSPPFDENILVGSTDPIPEDEEEELHKPEKQTYTSSTPDYKGLSTFIGDTLTIGSSLASTGCDKLMNFVSLIMAPISRRFSMFGFKYEPLFAITSRVLGILQSAFHSVLNWVSIIKPYLQRFIVKVECHYKAIYDSVRLKLYSFPVLEKDDRAARITKFFFILLWSIFFTFTTRLALVVIRFVLKFCVLVITLPFRIIALPYWLLKRIMKPVTNTKKKTE